LNLAGWLARHGREALAILPEEGPLTRELAAAGVAVRTVPLPVLRRQAFRGMGIPRFFLSLAASRAPFARAADPFAPQAVVTITATTLNGALHARARRIPHVWYVQEIFREGGLKRRLFARMVGTLADAAAVPARAGAEGLVAGWPPLAPKVRIIPNVIDPAPYREGRGWVRRRLGLGPETILVGVAGRFNWWKGQREMVEAMALVRRARRDVAFVFAGTPFRGDEAVLEDFRARVAAAGLGEAVRLLGQVDDMPGFYPDLDLFVLPSVQPEPFGLVVLEAMAAGVPVVAFDHGGPRDILDPSCGLLVPPTDQGALAEAILALAADPARRAAMGRAAGGRVEERYTPDRQGEAFALLLDKLAGGGR
jgi:glycosyltransferase involved in cell wall biosynthesis